MIFSLNFYQKEPVGGNREAATYDVMQVQMLIVMGLQSIVKAPIMAVWAIRKIAGKGEEWTLSTAAAIVILLMIVVVAISLTLPKFKKLQRLTDDLNRVTRENLTGLRVVRAYNAERYQEEKFARTNDELTRTHLFTGRVIDAIGGKRDGRIGGNDEREQTLNQLLTKMDGFEGNNTLLAPQMSPIHFDLLTPIFEKNGYHVVMLNNATKKAVDVGLRSWSSTCRLPTTIWWSCWKRKVRRPSYRIYWISSPCLSMT